MIKAAVDGRIDYSRFDSRNARDLAQEQILLEAIGRNLYTELWKTMVLMSGNKEACHNYMTILIPWVDWSSGRDKAEMQMSLSSIRKEQYKNPAFRREVDKILEAGAPSRDVAEQMAEFRMVFGKDGRKK